MSNLSTKLKNLNKYWKVGIKLFINDNTKSTQI